MASIYYEKAGDDVYKIDETAQRLIVYLYLHGSVTPSHLIEPIGADNEHAVRSLIEKQLGKDAAQLVEEHQSYQQKIGNHPDEPIFEITLTEPGENFLKQYRSELSMPVEIAELAKRVSSLRMKRKIVSDLENRISELEDFEERITQIEGRIDKIEDDNE